MRKRQLGKNGPDLTAIGFGSWAIGGPWEYGWGPVNDDDSIKAIRRAFELGINWIDTAAEYGLGHSEEVVAKARENYVDILHFLNQEQQKGHSTFSELA